MGLKTQLPSALRSAAERGVSIRLILNGAYLDEDIQNAIDTFNEQWNGSDGLDGFGCHYVK